MAQRHLNMNVLPGSLVCFERDSLVGALVADRHSNTCVEGMTEWLDCLREMSDPMNGERLYFVYYPSTGVTLIGEKNSGVIMAAEDSQGQAEVISSLLKHLGSVSE